jgi:hypothetical protein
MRITGQSNRTRRLGLGSEVCEILNRLGRLNNIWVFMLPSAICSIWEGTCLERNITVILGLVGSVSGAGW